MLLQSIKLTNLLSFRDAELELRALNVLIGPNASGKSNLFAAIGLLKAAPEDLQAAVWMVECMESLFLADIDALGRYYRRDFAEVLRGNPNVEEIPKRDVLARLKAATGGRYHKTKDAPHLLKQIQPQRVKRAAPNCRRLFERFVSG